MHRHLIWPFIIDRALPLPIVPIAFDVDAVCKAHGGKELNSSDFSNQQMLGFQLVRRVAQGITWHPANDNLRGTDAYGTLTNDPKNGPTGSIRWDFDKVEYFMFSTGDFSEWCVGALLS